MKRYIPPTISIANFRLPLSILAGSGPIAKKPDELDFDSDEIDPSEALSKEHHFGGVWDEDEEEESYH